MEVDKDTLLSELVSRHPETWAVFGSHGMHCTGCMGAPDETVEVGACMHGLDFQQLVRELNQAIAGESQPSKTAT